MKLDKAIEILDLNLNVADKKMPPDVKDALQLAIEAMEELQVLRSTALWGEWDVLPSETKD